MPAPCFDLSLIVPTRGRPEALARFLRSLANTARSPERLEVILVVDTDDECPDIAGWPFSVRVVAGPPGRTMGQLNRDGFTASRGAFVMLLNDDVIARTRGWDRIVLKQFRRFPDPVVLVHVNDTLIREYLCTFPILTREFVELAGGICPAEYERYRIDDHIEDAFNMLAHVGVRRSVYLADVIFEHCNSVNHPTAGAVYESDPAILARDAPRFETLLPVRKELALRALERIHGHTNPEMAAKINAISDSFALRVPGRQIVVRAWNWRWTAFIRRMKACYGRGGFRGVLRAAATRLLTVR
jgi:glycosyltransferase involved in cell wall biosynthesis